MERYTVPLVGRRTKLFTIPPWMLVGFMRPTRRLPSKRLAEAVAGKVILVTGASSGIGEDVARRVGAAGATVILVARREDRLQAVADDINAEGPGTAHVLAADLSSPQNAEDLAHTVLDQFGRVDVLVNNAGKSINRSISRSLDRIHDYERTMDVNYIGPVKLVLELLPSMREQGGAHIVNVSTLGLVGPSVPGWTPYLASKSAFDIFIRAVGIEFSKKNITTSSVYMSLVSTEMSLPSQDFFEGVPSISSRHAAELVTHAIVDKPLRVAPVWTVGSAVFGQVQGPTERLMRVIVKRQKTQGPKRGVNKSESEDTKSRETVKS